MKQKFKGSKKQQKKLALDEIIEILNKAKVTFAENPDLAHKYAKKARRTALKYKIKLPLNLKRKICKYCYSYLVPGKTLRVRTNKGHVVYYCLICKKFMRIMYT